jgi:glycosyltransferase involved in cell wall biosynthesis
MNWPDERIFNSAPIVSDSVDHHFSLIYAGTIAERYGLQTAIRALPLIRDEIPGLRLRILGRGDYIAALQQLARELKVEDIVTFEAPVPLAEVPSVYHSVSVGISPQCDPLFGQIYFSTKVAEYLAVGLPAVVAETPIMSFYYDDSQVAFFMPGDYRDFAARVLKIYQDPAYRQLLIQNGMELSRRCHWSHERETYLSVISALVSRRG